MGATHERSVFYTLVPAAKSGMAGIVLGIGRAIGETMAVVIGCRRAAAYYGDILRGIRTLTTNIVMEMGYAADLHREALSATGVVLFVFILLINLFSLIKRRGINNEKKVYGLCCARFRAYRNSPCPHYVLGVMLWLCNLVVLIYLIGYILVMRYSAFELGLVRLGIQFRENVSLMPALINTISMTLLSLVIAAPLGIFSSFYLVEYAKQRQ